MRHEIAELRARRRCCFCFGVQAHCGWREPGPAAEWQPQMADPAGAVLAPGSASREAQGRHHVDASPAGSVVFPFGFRYPLDARGRNIPRLSVSSALWRVLASRPLHGPLVWPWFPPSSAVRPLLPAPQPHSKHLRSSDTYTHTHRHTHTHTHTHTHMGGLRAFRFVL